MLAPAKDIQEVRNALLAYDHMPEWKSHRLSDLLKAHRILMTGLVDAPGQPRAGDVGVYRGQKLVHMAPPASQIARLIDELLQWLKTTDIHPLIASAVFHYEFEFIHPFADGNGRMGRLWQTLILSEWRSELGWLPVETLIHYQQDRYYQVLGQCDRQSDCTLFIAFMLDNIAAALKEGLEKSTIMSEEMSEESISDLTAIEKQILQILSARPASSAKNMAQECGVSARTIERYLKVLQQKGALQRIGATKGGIWRVC